MSIFKINTNLVKLKSLMNHKNPIQKSILKNIEKEKEKKNKEKKKYLLRQKKIARVGFFDGDVGQKFYFLWSVFYKIKIKIQPKLI